MEPIILASDSLRRQEFFKLMGLPFSVMPSKFDESQVDHTEGGVYTRQLAIKKVEKVIKDLEKRLPKWICGADTVVVSDDKIFEKPESREEAAAMLKELSGKQHKVITSVALYNSLEKKMDSITSICMVSFASLSDAEIEWYLDTNEWQGVAGAYRIQGLGSCFIDRIDGCPNTVVGLPLHDFYVMLRNNGYPYGAQ